MRLNLYLTKKTHLYQKIYVQFLLSGDKGSKTKEVDDKISQACKEIGVFYITGHGVGIDLMEEILNIAKKFFDLPREKKMKLKLKNSYRGYVDLG